MMHTHNTFYQEYIKECAAHTVVIETSLSGFDVSGVVVVVGREYD